MLRAAPWWLVGTCRSCVGLPSSFFPVRGCRCPALSQVPGVTEKSAEWPQPVFLFPAIARECLAGSCSPAGEGVWAICVGTALKCLLPSSLPSDRPSPAHGVCPGSGVRNEFGSFLLLHGRTLRSPPFSPPFLPLTNVIWGHLGALLPGEWGPPMRKHPQTHC